MWHNYIESKCMKFFTCESINEITRISRFALCKPSLLSIRGSAYLPPSTLCPALPSLPALKILHFFAIWLLSHVQLFVTPCTAARQASLSFTISQSLHRFMSTESMMPSNHLVFCHAEWHFPESVSIPINQLFASGSQSIGASAPVILMNIQS